VAEYSVSFHPLASDELHAAHAWYAERSSRAAERFAVEIEMAVARVSESPIRYPRIRGEVRRHLLLTFPFSLLYRVRDETIEVVAVAHHRRRPGYWKRR
jgi:plasmid stabilization system protein ParE